MEVTNLVVHRRSAVAEHEVFEPHLAVQPVLAHEALWLDSGRIPLRESAVLRALCVDGVVDAADDGVVVDADGRRTIATLRDGGWGVVAKRVRRRLERGAFDEYLLVPRASARNVVHENVGEATAALYRPVLERRAADGGWSVVADHRWQMQYASGVVALLDATDAAGGPTLALTFYEYTGRIGAPPAAAATTAEAPAPPGATHVGDVVGHVTGTVSSLDNHSTIRAHIVGGGEGEWTGTFAGSVVGRFEGEAVVTGGHLQCSRLRVQRGEVACDVSCDASGRVRAERFYSPDVQTDHLTTRGIDNTFSGIHRAGTITGVDYLHAKRLECDDVIATVGVRCGVLVAYDVDLTDAEFARVFVDGRLEGCLGAARASSIRLPCRRDDPVRVEIRRAGRDAHVDFTSTSERAIVLGRSGARITDDFGDRTLEWRGAEG